MCLSDFDERGVCSPLQQLFVLMLFALILLNDKHTEMDVTSANK